MGNLNYFKRQLSLAVSYKLSQDIKSIKINNRYRGWKLENADIFEKQRPKLNQSFVNIVHF